MSIISTLFETNFTNNKAALFFSITDLNALPCYKLESKMRKVDPTYDLATPMVIDESSPVLSDDLLEHRLSEL